MLLSNDLVVEKLHFGIEGVEVTLAIEDVEVVGKWSVWWDLE